MFGFMEVFRGEVSLLHAPEVARGDLVAPRLRPDVRRAAGRTREKDRRRNEKREEAPNGLQGGPHKVLSGFFRREG